MGGAAGLLRGTLISYGAVLCPAVSRKRRYKSFSKNVERQSALEVNADKLLRGGFSSREERLNKSHLVIANLRLAILGLLATTAEYTFNESERAGDACSSALLIDTARRSRTVQAPSQIRWNCLGYRAEASGFKTTQTLGGVLLRIRRKKSIEKCFSLDRISICHVAEWPSLLWRPKRKLRSPVWRAQQREPREQEATFDLNL